MSEHSIPKDANAEDISDLKRPELDTKELQDAAEAEAIDRVYAEYLHLNRPRKSNTGWLTDSLLRKTHGKMFGAIWAWGGRYRQVDLNLGVRWHQVPGNIQQLVDDFKYWDSPDCRMKPIEVAAHVHHRLTLIHPFKNGNGRHARFITDLFLRSKNERLPKWPQIHRMTMGSLVRKSYVAALKSSDIGQFELLVEFMTQCQEGIFPQDGDIAADRSPDA